MEICHTVLIPLSQDKFAVIDFDDYELVAGRRWFAARRQNKGDARPRFYAVSNIRNSGGGKQLLMHRVLTDAPKGVDVDHRDHNGLNNRRNNLRRGDRSHNCANSRKRRNLSSAFKGVSLDKRSKKWKAYIKVQYKYIHLGVFDVEIDAALAYNAAAIEAFGEFANLNQVPS